MLKTFFLNKILYTLKTEKYIIILLLFHFIILSIHILSINKELYILLFLFSKIF